MDDTHKTKSQLVDEVRELRRRMDELESEVEECRLAKRGMEMEKDRTRSLIQDSPVFLVAIGPDGKILLVNNALLDVMGCSRDQTSNMETFTALIPETDHEALSRIFGTFRARTAEQKTETGLYTKDGRQLLVEWHGRTVYDPNGMLKALFCIGIDATERRKGDEELLERVQKVRSCHFNQSGAKREIYEFSYSRTNRFLAFGSK
jgi:PAS domain S-box-containing protein